MKLLERDFQGLLDEAFRVTGRLNELRTDVRLGSRMQLDGLARTPDGDLAIIEVRFRTLQTESRLLQAARQLSQYGDEYHRINGTTPRLILILPDVSLAEKYGDLLKAESIEVWDKTFVTGLLQEVPLEALSVAAQNTARLYLGPQQACRRGWIGRK